MGAGEPWGLRAQPLSPPCHAPTRAALGTLHPVPKPPSLLLTGRRDVDGERNHRQHPQTTTQRGQPSPWVLPTQTSAAASILSRQTIPDTANGAASSQTGTAAPSHRRSPRGDRSPTASGDTALPPASPDRNHTRSAPVATVAEGEPPLSGEPGLRRAPRPPDAPHIPAGRGAAAAAEPPAHPGEAAPTGGTGRDRGAAPATAGMSRPLPRGLRPPLGGVCPRSACHRRAPAPSRRGGRAAPGTLHPPHRGPSIRPPLSAGSAGRGRAPPPPPAGACLEPSAAPAPAPPRAVRGHRGTRRAAPAPP
ncbi:basic proline-rich protein-like [Poecile atricapillus]|uniref:basic proline-rich protein-like n=1 Tax=Poecile atricapillus TaxID=48891 RepID=UPI0027394E16|nr:basic proline-rich protein-like [Poecile atricapillus]